MTSSRLDRRTSRIEVVFGILAATWLLVAAVGSSLAKEDDLSWGASRSGGVLLEVAALDKQKKPVAVGSVGVNQTVGVRLTNISDKPLAIVPASSLAVVVVVGDGTGMKRSIAWASPLALEADLIVLPPNVSHDLFVSLPLRVSGRTKIEARLGRSLKRLDLPGKAGGGPSREDMWTGVQTAHYDLEVRLDEQQHGPLQSLDWIRYSDVRSGTNTDAAERLRVIAHLGAEERNELGLLMLQSIGATTRSPAERLLSGAYLLVGAAEAWGGSALSGLVKTRGDLGVGDKEVLLEAARLAMGGEIANGFQTGSVREEYFYRVPESIADEAKRVLEVLAKDENALIRERAKAALPPR